MTGGGARWRARRTARAGAFARGAVLLLALEVVIAAGGVALVAMRAGGDSRPEVVMPSDTPSPSVTPTPTPTLMLTPTPSPTPSPTLSRTPRPKATARAVVRSAPKPDRLAAFRRLGVWVDLYDIPSLDPATAVADMRARGVKALFIQTSRYTKPDDIVEPEKLGQWIERAHAAGMRVVGWYLPGYGDLERDVRRTVAIKTFASPAGQRMDALAVDIEAKDETGGGDPFNEGIAEHLKRVRAQVGTSYPIGAIVPSPVAMEIRPQNWVGFPWAEIGRRANVVMPMGYWTYRTDCDTDPTHCPYGYSKGNIDKAHSFTGLPVHEAGGVGDKVKNVQEIKDFVRATRERKALGGSLYDYRTTNAAWWSELAKLNRL